MVCMLCSHGVLAPWMLAWPSGEQKTTHRGMLLWYAVRAFGWCACCCMVRWHHGCAPGRQVSELAMIGLFHWHNA
eukprot:1100323-Pelagomonas_calceolata.AAC.2